jgi:signal transduction histidine kinase
LDDSFVMKVSDNGPGIPLQEREKVLQRLYRLDRSRSTPGYGLGLSLVEAVAALHGAVLSLGDNTPGLSVTLRFPN